MPRRLLALVLVMAQLLSWSAPPVYLCLESDGSVGIDSGPEHCDCHEQGAASEHLFAEDQHHDQHSHLDGDCRADGDACDCTHIQISEQQGPALVSSAIWFDIHDAVAACVAPTCCASLLAADLEAASGLSRLSAIDLSPPSARCCANLRC